MKYLKWIWISAIFSLGTPLNSFAQDNGVDDNKTDQIIIQPLFEYPVAPDNIVGLQEKCDWLIEHFWDNMNFKDKTTVDQNALNHAFDVYVSAMRHAEASKVALAVDKLLSQTLKNPALALQFAKAAEETLYGPRAEVWNDQIFMKFIDNVLKNKNIKKERKIRYERLYKILNNSLQGSIPPEFDYVTPDGKTSHYHPNGVITVIEFGTPDCMDCRLSKLKMDTNVKFSSLVDKGKINVLYINIDPKEGWQEEMKDFPEKWYIGASQQVNDLFDLRVSPALYVIDREGKVAIKNTDVETAMAIASAAAEQ